MCDRKDTEVGVNELARLEKESEESCHARAGLRS